MFQGKTGTTIGNMTKLGKFLRMKPSECDIGMCYEPGTLGRLNLLTMRMENSCGSKQNFGQDKIWIETLGSGSTYEFCSGNTNTTRITIITENEHDYENCDQKICSHGLEVGDLIYIYDQYT